jgi:hypothetical protein
MSKMFQISERDLESLEKDLPFMSDRLMMPHLDNATRAAIRRVQTIIMNVRWDYQPWGEIGIVPAGNEEEASSNA